MKSYNQKLLELLNRDHLPLFLSKYAPDGKMAEVGTYFGEFAAHIARSWKGQITCIDPWEDQPDEVYRDGCANGGVAGGRNKMAPIYQAAMDRFRIHRNIQVAQMTSMQGLERFQNDSLDCVYIDANHKYRNALEDLKGWIAKVRPGGILGIHDCYTRRDDVQDCGVWDAVWEFSHMTQSQPFLTNCTSAWWII